MTRSDRVAGLVLAAGTSSRHPASLKLLLPFGAGTVVGSSVGAALEADLAPVLVVVGHRSAEVRRAVNRSDVLFVENPRYETGVGGSVAAGIRHLAADTAVGGCAILLADEPEISPSVIRHVVRAWRDTGAAVVRATYRDRPGHPVVLDRSVFDLLARAEGDEGLSGILRREKMPCEAVHVDRVAPTDIDTPEDYERAAGRT